MKVVHVIRSLEFGGAEKLVLELARTQLATGRLDVSLACLMPGGALTAEAEALGLGVEVVSIEGI
ncbi:MAG TPA: hypothetical protein VLA34_01520, partial [Candidatus Krumholzibacterium sp.]|nr:hypothetical protein [Candidatus Krumholzibacterium sp.]